MQNKKLKKTAILTLSFKGYLTALRIIKSGIDADLYVPSQIAENNAIKPIVKIFDAGIQVLTENIYDLYEGLVYIMPSGIVVRSIAPFLKSKYSDPAVVTVDICGRWVISTLSGHEGGANELSDHIARALHCEPIITTSTESIKKLIAGIGCRKGTSVEAIDNAVHKLLTSANCNINQIRVVCTVDIKEKEEGLLNFCKMYSLPLRIISREQIGELKINCKESQFVKDTIGIGAVAVPCALLGGTKTKLITDRYVCQNVTVALAREYCEW